MIKRYDLPLTSPDCMQRNDAGEYVRYEDHAAEVERLRAENERLRADRDARRADGIYGAMIAAAYPHVSVSVAIGHAEDAVDAWRAAQKGGSDG